MLITIVIRELRHNFLSLRFPIAFLITLAVFSFGAIAFLSNYHTAMLEYEKYQNEQRHGIETTVKNNLTQFAVKKQDFILKPRDDAFITGSKEKYIPNSITFSAFNVFGFETRSGSSNPYLNPFEELNWGFIVSIILSFTVFLFTYDSISGEKETRTLAVSLANSVSRGTLLFGKYLTTIVTLLVIMLPGMLLGLILILLSGEVALTPAIMLEVIGFILTSMVFISCIAAFGLLSSVLVENSDVSLLIALITWVFFIVIIPNSATFWSQTLSPIDTSDAIKIKILSAKDILEKNGEKGRWSMMHDNPFYPFHKVRAKHQTNLMNSEMQIKNEYYRDMFHQLERTRMLTFASPVSLYEYLCESVVGGGYLRFQIAWKDIQAYQVQFLAWFKAKDAQDPDSPHWYNPYEDVSTTRKQVNPAEVPVFSETVIPAADRFLFAGKYLTVMVLFTTLVFFTTFVLFARYDVR